MEKFKLTVNAEGALEVVGEDNVVCIAFYAQNPGMVEVAYKSGGRKVGTFEIVSSAKKTTSKKK